LGAPDATVATGAGVNVFVVFIDCHDTWWVVQTAYIRDPQMK
jgi:hypothetical protein